MNSFWSEPVDGNLMKAVLIFAAVFLLTSLILLLARNIAFRTFRKWAAKTDTRADDIILESLKHPSVYWTVAIGLYIALDTSHFPQEYVNYGLSLLYVILVLSITIAVANITSRLAENAIQKSAANANVPVTGLSRTVIKAFIFSIGFLIILNSLGISITPILTALGVGGLAVALALQDSLSNLFAGIHILVEKPVTVGDYIRLNTGEEGVVADIGWRTTRIRQLSNNIVIVPNNKLAQSIITNFSLPDKKTAVPLKIGVSYSVDPDFVESVLLDEVNKALGAVKGLLHEPPPGVKLSGFGESSVEFTLGYHVSEYTDQFEVQHELRKRIFKRLKAEGIEIPFPVRTVHLKQ